MCLFPFSNNNIKSKAYQAGVREFDCGACPECLSKRARKWALRCCAQAEVQNAVMVTLTYDTYIRDNYGRIIGERVSDLSVNKKDCQDFIKRLRRYHEYHFGISNIKYLITAEYGKRTYRAHYHAILFGVNFDDVTFYKKSKRGNIIYKSAILDKLWKHGICTVDAVNMSAKIARYCTKYCAKDTRTDNTFMLCSRGIGSAVLLQKFNGIGYMIEGIMYPIPREIWRDYIEAKYNIKGYSRYVSYKDKLSRFERMLEGEAEQSIAASKAQVRAAKKRQYFAFVRDNDYLYKRYIKFWKDKSAAYREKQPDILTRILRLSNEKYFAYKQAALAAFIKRSLHKSDDVVLPPRSNCCSRYLRRKSDFEYQNGLPQSSFGVYPLVNKRQMTQYTFVHSFEGERTYEFELLPEYIISPFDVPDYEKLNENLKKVYF